MIITLPITVKNEAPLGYWLTPIIADALSRQLGEPGTFYYGKLGLKKPDSWAEKIFHEYLDFLGIRCERRTDAELVPELLSICDELATVGTIDSHCQDCFLCPCGRLELPVHIAGFAKEKTFIRSKESYICKACGEEGVIQAIHCRILRLKEQDILNDLGIYPHWYRSEVVNLQCQIQEQGISWSKSRSTGLHGDLDIELAWSLIPLLLSRKSQGERIRIVITNHVIRQALVTVWLAHALDPTFRADLVVTPCIDHPGSIEKWRLERLINLGFSGGLLRCMLIGSLGWQVKNARLYDSPAGMEYRRFQLFERHSRLSETNCTTHYELTDIFQNLNQQNLAQGLKRVFNPENFDYKTLMGVL